MTATVGFLVLGGLASVLGPTLPPLRARHDLGGGGAALLLASFSAGSALGVCAAGFLRRRMSPAVLLSAAAGAVAAGCAALPVASGPAVAYGCLLLAGIGFGAVDLLLNLLLARSYGDRGAAVLMGVSAAFGVSAVGTPLMVGRTPTDLMVPYTMCAVGALVLLVMACRLCLPPGTAPRSNTAGATSAGFGAPRSSGGQAWLLVLLAAVLLGYVTVEGGVAGWETTHLRVTMNLAEADAARAVSLFWAGLTLGRLLTAPLALRVSPGRIVITALTTGTASLLAASHPPVSIAAYAVTGLLMAPVFPSVIAWHTARVPSGRGATRVFAAGLAGPVITAPVVGLAIDTYGVAAVPWVLAALAAVTAALAISIATVTHPRHAHINQAETLSQKLEAQEEAC